MNKLADAYDLLAEAYATLALELRNPAVEKGGPSVGSDIAPALTEHRSSALPPMEELPFDDDLPAIGEKFPTQRIHPDEWERQLDAEPHGSAAVCPAHNIEYRDGKYGKYCPSTGTDPEWTNTRGYCRITPKNAAAYLRQKAAR